jgi:hypothetical protein
MEASADFGTSRLFVADSRLALGVLNHLRHQALNRVFGVSRGQANLLTAVLLLGAADGTYEAARRATGMLRISGPDAVLGAAALREAALGVAGPSTRVVPGAGTLLALAILGGLAGPVCGKRPTECAPPSSDCAPRRPACGAGASGATPRRKVASERARRRQVKASSRPVG